MTDPEAPDGHPDGPLEWISHEQYRTRYGHHPQTPRPSDRAERRRSRTLLVTPDWSGDMPVRFGVPGWGEVDESEMRRLNVPALLVAALRAWHATPGEQRRADSGNWQSTGRELADALHEALPAFDVVLVVDGQQHAGGLDDV